MTNKRILDWVNNFKNEKMKVLFVYGDVGIGKFKYIEDNIKENYNLNIFNYIDFLYKKDITHNITHTNNTNNVFFMLTKRKKPIIIIKEVEHIKTKLIINILKDINVKNIKKKKNKINIPIILIGSGKCIKAKKDLDGYCEIYEFKKENKEIIKNNIDNILKDNTVIVSEVIKNKLNKNVNNYNKIQK